jgi:hypothetical protein
MTWFPQIGAGSVAQFPLTRVRRWRNISNQLESGERIVLADRNANEIGWELNYQDLSDTEVVGFTDLFDASQGQAFTFFFADPLANLLGWSEDLTRPEWQTNLLQTSPGIADPVGSQRAWSIANGAAGALALQQTLGLSGDYMACFSVWVRSAGKTTVVLQRDSQQTVMPVGTAWKRVSLNGRGTSGATESTFGVLLAPGQGIQVFGPQVEVQPYPSTYKSTTVARGIYQQTSFAADELNIVSTSVGLSSCQITLRSRV